MRPPTLLHPVPPGTPAPDPNRAVLNDMLATGASYRQIDYWTRVGYLSPPKALPGSGFSRDWTKRDVAMARLMIGLITAGVVASTAAEWAALTVDEGIDATCVNTPAGSFIISWSQVLTQPQGGDLLTRLERHIDRSGGGAGVDE